MKGRFQQLKTGTRVHDHIDTNHIWLTCCALHNMILEVDRIDEDWEAGVDSDWEGELGQHNPEDVLAKIPESICNRMILEGQSVCSADYSGSVHGEDVNTDLGEDSTNF